MIRKIGMLLKVTGACALLLVSVACKSYTLVSGGTYSWKTSFIYDSDPKYTKEIRESATVRRDGANVTIYLEKGDRIVGTLEGDKFSGQMLIPPDTIAVQVADIQLQGHLTKNNCLEGTLTSQKNGQYKGSRPGKGTWTLEYAN